MRITDAQLAELSQFISDRTGRVLTEDWVRMILSKVISGAEAVLDLQRGGRRLGVAVVIDTCETEGNAAELSIFPATRDEAVYRELLDWGEVYIAQGARDHVDVAGWPGVEPPEHLLFERGYRIAHRLYEMVRPESVGAPPASEALPPGWSWREPEEGLVPDYYEVRAAAFESVPGAYLPPYEMFRDFALEGDSTARLAVDREGRVQAFVRVTPGPDGGGEITILGRHPRCRGRGLGAILVAHGLSMLWSRGTRHIRLDVAATNETAIELYGAFGFQLTSRMRVYRRPVQRG